LIFHVIQCLQVLTVVMICEIYNQVQLKKINFASFRHLLLLLYINGRIIKEYYFIWQLTSVFHQNGSHDVRQHSTHCH